MQKFLIKCFKILFKTVVKLDKKNPNTPNTVAIKYPGSHNSISLTDMLHNGKRCTTSKIQDLIGGEGIAEDYLYEITIQAITEAGMSVKYICPKCKETLVDDESELESIGGLGYWCKSCLEEQGLKTGDVPE